mmetsp:Transcript_61611/g.125653  ORF Transcript_61611/g.125653 Transcript_61611/m.125653 type:complete len:146 (+) Transcript_61611:419-856(+)
MLVVVVPSRYWCCCLRCVFPMRDHRNVLRMRWADHLQAISTVKLSMMNNTSDCVRLFHKTSGSSSTLSPPLAATAVLSGEAAAATAEAKVTASFRLQVTQKIDWRAGTCPTSQSVPVAKHAISTAAVTHVSTVLVNARAGEQYNE